MLRASTNACISRKPSPLLSKAWWAVTAFWLELTFEAQGGGLLWILPHSTGLESWLNAKLLVILLLPQQQWLWLCDCTYHLHQSLIDWRSWCISQCLPCWWCCNNGYDYKTFLLPCCVGWDLVVWYYVRDCEKKIPPMYTLAAITNLKSACAFFSKPLARSLFMDHNLKSSRTLHFRKR